MEDRAPLQGAETEAGTVLTSPGARGRQEPERAQEKGTPLAAKTSVVLAGTGRGASVQLESAVRDAAEATTDFSWLSRGDPVFIKPVLNSGNPYPYTTSPVALGSMIELLREKGAGRIIVGDMSGIEHVRPFRGRPRGSTRALMESSGMAAAVLAAGGDLYPFEDGGWEGFYEEHPTSGSNWQKGLMMPGILKEVEHIILMPRCARHVVAGSSLGLKAAVGYWRTDTRIEYHRDAATLHEKTAEGNTVPTLLEKQRLVLSAADQVVVTFGPDDGRVCQPENGLVIASQSVVAHDMVSLAWLIECRRSMPLLGRYSFIDRSRLLARIGNRMVVGWLSDWGTALASEPVTKNGLTSIWDDRTLNHAYQVLGGRPQIALEVANGLVPVELQDRLSEMSTKSDD
jgi:uncharacterized protein (DUF362 family)